MFLLVTAVAQWTQPQFLTVAFPVMLDQPGLLWLFGMLTFASGLAVVLGHNDWSPEAPEITSTCDRSGPRKVSRMPRYSVISGLRPKNTPASFSSKRTSPG